MPSDQPLCLHAHEVTRGRLEILEALCVGSFDPEIVVFIGAGEPGEFGPAEDDQPLARRTTADWLDSYAAIMAYYGAAAFAPSALVVGP